MTLVWTQQPVSRTDVVSAERLLARLAREKRMQALSWVHSTHPIVIVDLLVGEGFQWSTALIEDIHLFGLPVPALRREELIRLKRAAGREKDLRLPAAASFATGCHRPRSSACPTRRCARAARACGRRSATAAVFISNRGRW